MPNPVGQSSYFGVFLTVALFRSLIVIGLVGGLRDKAKVFDLACLGPGSCLDGLLLPGELARLRCPGPPRGPGTDEVPGAHIARGSSWRP